MQVINMVATADILLATAIGTILLAVIAYFWPTYSLAIWVAASVASNSYVFSSQMDIFHLHPSHLLLLGVLLGLCVRGSCRLHRPATGDRPDLAMMAFVGWAVITGCISGNLLRDDAVRVIGILINGFVMPVIILYFAQSLPQTRESIAKVCNIMALLLAYLTFTAFCEHFHIDWLIFPTYILDPTVGLHPDRARGPVTNAAENGGIIAMLILIAWHRISCVANPVIRRISTLVLLAACVPALWFTETRGPWIAFSGGLVVMLWHKRCRVAVLTLGVSIIIVVSLVHLVHGEILPQRTTADTTDTTDFRLTLYRESLAAFVEHPLVGWGLGTFTSKDRPFDSGGRWQILGSGDVQHDTTVAIATENGLIGVALYVAFFVLIVRSLLVLHRSVGSSEHRDFYVLCLSVLAVLLINGFFADFRDWMPHNGIAFLLAGLGLAVPLNRAVPPGVSRVSFSALPKTQVSIG
jgi:O-antigen ligase